MSKRKPTSELNDRNWDIEEEPEEAGTFSAAGRDVLKNRVIRKAKRTIHTENRPASGSIFAGFALKTDTSSAASSKPALSTGVTHTFGANLNLTTKTNGATSSSSNDNSVIAATAGGKEDNPEYLRQLKLLNENILSWIQKHVKENPYCILTPSFKDYERHEASLEKKYSVQLSSYPSPPSSSSASSLNSPLTQDKGKTESSLPQPAALNPAPAPSAAAAASTFKGFQFEKKDSEKETKSVFGSAAGGGLASGFTFGQTPTTNSSDKSASEAGGFKFGSGLTQSKGGFSGFGASSDSTKPFSFASAAKTTTDSTPSQSSGDAAGGEDEEYQPPKVEVKEIKEEGAVYTKRCKLFYQKAGQWTDRGVGNLHLKPTQDGRTQLVIRADTNLGNILLNILLQPTIPTKRQGKNNVFFVCVPNPPLDTKAPSSEPTPMLLRVKTSEDADELLAKLDELKA